MQLFSSYLNIINNHQPRYNIAYPHNLICFTYKNHQQPDLSTLLTLIINKYKHDVNYMIINKNIENKRKQKWFGTLIFAHLILMMTIKLICIGLLWLLKLS